MPPVILASARSGMFQMKSTLRLGLPDLSAPVSRARRTAQTIQKMSERPWLRSRKHMLRPMTGPSAGTGWPRSASKLASLTAATLASS